MGEHKYRNVNNDRRADRIIIFREKTKNGMFKEGEEDAVSFKISRKSDAASSFKALISDKLLLFLSDYTDDVLSEYITVLVCNGKNQYQAKDDLEAFLGERSCEFISWLWELLLKYYPQGKGDMVSSDLQAVVSSSHDSQRGKDSEIDKSGNFHFYGNGPKKAIMTKDEKIYEQSASAYVPVSPNDTEHAEGHQHPVLDTPYSQVKTKKVLLHDCGTESNYPYPLMNESYEKGSFGAILPAGIQDIQCTDEPKKIFYGNSSTFHNQLQCFPKRESPPRNPESTMSGRPGSPKYGDGFSCHSKKLRRSVWDRLGKPCDDTALSSKNNDVYGVSIILQNKEKLHEHVSVLPVPDGELMRNAKEIAMLGNRCESNNPPKSKESEHAVSTTVSEPLASNNMRRKRHFGEISNGACTGSVPLVGDSTMELQLKEPEKDSVKPNLTGKASNSTPKLVSEVLSVKQRLDQVEMEMYKLRAKQREKDKGVKTHMFSQSGAVKHKEDDVESRTIFLSNVHSAATKNAILLYFTKCGAVDNVVILINKATGQPKGAAYVTFAKEESVEKAVCLSGSTFFSRTLKVMKKAEAATEAQLAGKLSQAVLPQVGRNAVPGRKYFSCPHLQWRRESTSAPSKPSAPTTGEGKEVISSTSSSVV